ncbi:MAG: hypothetical protein RBR87_08070 [Bacteroidales bacterium]|jgi:hypothetical protein|nr:hypothetical protein [Bacteroidales bacterium]
MKKIITLTTAFTIMVLFFSSCATHMGTGMSNASLSQNNFKIVKFATGDVSTTKVFGLGGLSKTAMVAEAKQELLANHPLKDGQALANMTVDWKTGFYFFIIVTQCTVTADIVQFD